MCFTGLNVFECEIERENSSKKIFFFPIKLEKGCLLHPEEDLESEGASSVVGTATTGGYQEWHGLKQSECP